MTALRLISGFKRLALRERLEARAKVLFPSEAEKSRRGKWVEAKLLLGNTEPKVPVGTSAPAVFSRVLPGAKFK